LSEKYNVVEKPFSGSKIPPFRGLIIWRRYNKGRVGKQLAVVQVKGEVGFSSASCTVYRRYRMVFCIDNYFSIKIYKYEKSIS
jgi:hypothetical protein